ncbi:MAG: tRNA-dihydrouridine synthase, partial [Clostridiales Family XIII bacterium]|jgi:nifR3 family TIM-barrel protein|nr:tRNA-dihydrouridine synthase [Clostridiales Family XIII bacterium]
VTAKIRAGWDAARVNCVEVARTLEAAGADAVCVHPRTREQYYGGRADWSLIARVKAAVRIPVIGNGDVRSAADAARMIEETGCDYVMIGRGALGNPWVFAGGAGGVSATTGTGSTTSEVGVPTLQEKTAMFLRHARLVCEDKGEHTAVLEMRKHAGWYFKGVPGAAAFRGTVNRLTTLAELTAAAEAFAGRIHTE